MKLSINEKGIVTFIYSDELVDLCAEGLTDIKRVSNVEPEGSKWRVKIINGPDLGLFNSRKEALDAEIEYLEAKLF